MAREAQRQLEDRQRELEREWRRFRKEKRQWEQLRAANLAQPNKKYVYSMFIAIAPLI